MSFGALSTYVVTTDLSLKGGYSDIMLFILGLPSGLMYSKDLRLKSVDSYDTERIGRSTCSWRVLLP